MTRYAFTLSGRTHHVTVEEHALGPRFVVDGETFQPEVEALGGGRYRVTIDGEVFEFAFGDGRIELGAAPLDIQIRRARPALVRKGGAARRADGRVKPPMPGKIVEIPVKEGQEVREGDILVVLEAMKMQNDLKSPVTGVVSKVHVKEGQNVESTTVLVEVTPHDG